MSFFDVASGFQSQSRFCLIHFFAKANVMYQKANSPTLALKATFHRTTIFCLQIVLVILHHRVNVTSFTRKSNCHKCAKK